jgi:hypothetical protein
MVAYSITPVLLGLIVFQWIREIKNPKNGLDFGRIKKHRLVILAMLIWGVSRIYLFILLGLYALALRLFNKNTGAAIKDAP